MATINTLTTAVPTHVSRTLAPGPVITSGVTTFPMPSGSGSGSISPTLPTVSNIPGFSSSGPVATPSAMPSTPSSAVATNTQKKLSLAFALMVFLPAVFNAL
ncbi:hypothetical protein BGZ95_001286 [Linnemannia exigua]|uniref:Uncharacterized protein n=1 Tax=Linnemannia exigua TaxID=604196 RepID=A0AAD4DJB2_9FUNG|nr:hypothetical protein BGZ95_001286 [Linnemannia exigua]